MPEERAMTGLAGAAIFVPFFGMMLLTLAVWAFMYIRRLRWIAAGRVKVQTLATPERLSQAIPEAVNYPAHNLRNLCELPVLFYAIVLYLATTDTVDTVHLVCAWGFLIFRVGHSLVHCTVNRVALRFAFYAPASMCLWIMVLRGAVAALAA